MKKFVLLLIALFTLSMTNAQEISIGAKAGINYGATLTSDSDYNDNFEARLAPMFGVVAEFALTDKFSVQPELLYYPSGAKLKEIEQYIPTGIDTGFDATINGDRKVDYLNLPIMMKYYVMDGLSLEVGPYVGFLLAAKSTQTITDAAGNTIDAMSWEDEDVKEEYNSIDFGLGLGASYKLNNGLFFTGRYNYGLSNIEADEEDLEKDGEIGTDSFTIKNQMISISVGYMFM